jgi:Putative Ig domain
MERIETGMGYRDPARIVRAASVALGLMGALALSACCTINRITTDSLPDATVGELYSFALTHNCSGKSANAGASWELLDGDLPVGITLSYDGRLLGTPSAPGSFLFRVLLRVTSRGLGASTYDTGSDSRSYTLVVRP